MSVYIKGMEMPKGCAFCKISRRNGKKMICPFIWKCEWDIHDPMSADHRLDDCPLIPVPEHGRLIDADALITKVTDAAIKQPEIADVYYEQASEIGGWLYSMPTIIPASGGTDNE